jgi:hypothetical protein
MALRRPERNLPQMFFIVGSWVVFAEIIIIIRVFVLRKCKCKFS